MSRRAFDQQLRKTASELGFGGITTHSFRGSFLTASSTNGVPLRALQAISGHSDLGVLSRYLEVRDQAMNDAVMAGA